MRRRVIVLLLCMSLVLIPAFVAFSQDDPPPARLDLTGVNANQLPTLILTANVIGRTGQPIFNLGINNFVLGGPLADRAEIVNVENITDDELAFAAVLVIDTSTSMSGQPLAQAKEAARAFVNALGPNDPVAIVTFDSNERVVQDYTTDKAQLLQVIDDLAYGGQTALYDGAILGIETAARAPLPRRAVVLLSDGAEYGGISDANRADGLQMALDRGVPVFTVGLGYGIDRTYLREISEGSSAAFYESPAPETLPEIYRGLAQTFRTQYVVTIELNDFDLAREAGQTTDFTLQVNADAGLTNVVSSNVRVPINTPIVTLPEDLFANPLERVTVVTPTIVADDAIASTIFTTSEGSSEGESFIIDPLLYAPGTYPLSITVTDATDDATTLTTEFSIAALPSTLTLAGIPETPITEPITVTVTGEGQTPLTSVVYTFNEEETEITTPDDNFAFTLDPIEVAAGEHTLTVSATNEGGATSTLEQSLVVGDVAPRIIDVGFGSIGVIGEPTTPYPMYILQPDKTAEAVLTFGGREIPATDGVYPAINPYDFPPGDLEAVLRVTDSAGQSARDSQLMRVFLMPPNVDVTLPDVIRSEPAEAFVTVTAQPRVRIRSFIYSFNEGEAQSGTLDDDGLGTITIPAAELGNGEHTLTVTVNADEADPEQRDTLTTQTLTFRIAIATPTPTFTPSATPTQTLTPSPTFTATPTVDLTATREARATLTQGAVDVTLTAAARSTRSTVNTQAAETLVAVDTATSQALATAGIAQTAAARVTTEARRTEIAAANANAISTATADAQGTVAAAATLTALPAASETAQILRDSATATREARTTQIAEAAFTATAFVDSVTQTAINDAASTQNAAATQTQANVATVTGQAVAQVSTSAAAATQNAAGTATIESRRATATQNALSTLDAVQATNDQATQVIEDGLTATRAALNATFTQIAAATGTQAGLLTATQQQIEDEATTQANNILASETAVAQSTADAQSTRQAATINADATTIANVSQNQAALTATQNARATLTALPTLTPTIGPSATPPPPLVELDSERSPLQGLLDSLTGNPLVLVCVPLLCLLGIIVLFVLGGRRRRQAP